MRFLKEVVLFLLALLLGSISILTYEVVDTSGDSFSTIGHSHIYAAPIHRHFHEPPPNNFLRGGFSTQRLIVDKRDSHDTSFRAAAERSIAIREDIALQHCDFAQSDSARVFKDIYQNGVWSPGSHLNLYDLTPRMFYNYGDPAGSSKRPSLSGVGSVVGDATKISIGFLSSIIADYGITTMLDIPCGDANWQFEAWEVDSLQTYVGADIVSELIDLNQRRFAHHLNKHFVAWDFAKCPLPTLPADDTASSSGLSWSSDTSGYVRRKAFDLVHARDVFQHMPLERAAQAAKHIKESGCRFALVTTWPRSMNERISEGSFYLNNMEEYPFNYPKPVKCIQTHPHLEEDLTCLYDFSF
jgi:hypothetical protein